MIIRNGFSANPFRHWVIADLIHPDLVRAIESEWPEEGWRKHEHGYSNKRGNQDIGFFGPTTRRVIDSLCSEEWMDRLSIETEIEGLQPDTALAGGGLHETFPDGFLGIHADFNTHPETRLIRRLNLLLFLNQDWQEEWGGFLELWNRQESRCQVRFAPIAGRCVIFETTDNNFHGHPRPLTCPPDRSRRSIALYYYSPALPNENPADHSTLYLGDEDNWPKRIA